MSINFDDVKKKINEEYEELKKKVKKPNILIIGGTGVGKSSLVNICFGQDIAKVGIGKPVTKHTNAYYIPNIPIVLFDTQGYEIGSDKEKLFLNEIVDYAIKNKGKPDKQIHILWYCIQASGSRILDFDEKILKSFYQAGIPVALIFTKCDLVTEEEINEMQNLAYNLFLEIPSFQLTIKENLSYLDLNKLCDWSIEKLPEGLKFAFISAQKTNLEAKRKEARNIILQHTSGSALVGFSPIPFSDAPILLTNQAGMLARILFVYDMQSLIITLQGLMDTLGLPVILSQTGIWIAGQLLKLIPAVGTIAGGLITASIAAAFTSAIGFATSEICYRIYEMVLKDETEKLEVFFENIEDIFKDIFMENFKNNK